MKTYQDELPLSRAFLPVNPKPSPPRPIRPEPRPLNPSRLVRLGKILWQQFDALMLHGYWFCLDGQHVCDRIDGENGQPDHCSKCKSHRIEWNPPSYRKEAAA